MQFLRSWESYIPQRHLSKLHHFEKNLGKRFRKLLALAVPPLRVVLGVRPNYYVPSYTHTLHMNLRYDPAVALVSVVAVVSLITVGAVVSVVCVVSVL